MINIILWNSRREVGNTHVEEGEEEGHFRLELGYTANEG